MASRNKSAKAEASSEGKSKADNKPESTALPTYLVERVVTQSDIDRNPHVNLEVGEVIAYKEITRNEAEEAGVDVDKVESDLAEKHKDLENPIVVFEKGDFAPEPEGKKSEAGDFKLSLLIDGEAYESTASNFEDAILSLQVPKMVSKGTLVLEHDGMRAERMVFPKHLKRPLVNRDSATFLGKQMKMLLK